MVAQIHRAVWVVLLFLALTTIFIPSRTGAASPPRPSHCCSATSLPVDSGNDTAAPRCPLNPSPQNTCCAACALAMTFIAGHNPPFLFSNSSEKALLERVVRTPIRTDRPPVPPPRSAFV